MQFLLCIVTAQRRKKPIFESREYRKNKKQAKGGGIGSTSPAILHRTSDRCSLFSEGSSSYLMAQPLSSEGVDDVVFDLNFSIERTECIRILTQALYSLGYKKSAACLEEQTGIPLHSTAVNLFIQQILDGNWEESIATLNEIALDDQSIVTTATSLLIKEHKFFELLHGDKIMDALNTLRTEIAPHCHDSNRIRVLSSSLVFAYGQDGSSRLRVRTRLQLLEELQKLLPPTMMLVGKILEYLVETALFVQRQRCWFHNSSDEEMSLYSNHYHCGNTQIPSRTLQILEEHDDEVWFVKFSHNGKYLASASNDQTAIIWEVETNGRVSIKHKLCGHQTAVSSVCWSPNDQELLTCGVEEAVRCWDVSTGNCLQIYEKSGLGLISCAWFPCGKYILCGLSDRNICKWDLDGNEVEFWNGSKTLTISDLEIICNGRYFLTICEDDMLLIYDSEMNLEWYIKENQTITSFCVSKDEKFVLVNLLNQEIDLWSINNVMLLGRYVGHKRSRFVIRSCLGGFEQGFIASGSQDSKVYIWHRSSWTLVNELAGHSGAVNCVSWNPANPQMLASSSDDRTVRIWGL